MTERFETLADPIPVPPAEILVARPGRGGVAYVAHSVAAEFRRQGYKVTEVEVADSGVPARVALSSAWHHRLSLRRARTVHIELGRTSLATFWFAFFACLIRRDVAIVLHDSPVLVRHPGAGLMAAIPGWRDTIAYRILAPLLDRPLARVVRHRSGARIVLTEQARDAAIAAGFGEVNIVELGGEPSTPNIPSPGSGDCVLFAGFLGPDKGLEVLCEAWGLAGPRSPLPLRIAGAVTSSNAAWAADLRRRFDDVDQSVEWLGWLDESAFESAIAHSAIVVLPYTKSNPASGVLVRAMIEGRAILATRVPATEAVEDGVTGLLVPCDDAEKLGEALSRLLDDPMLRDRLGSAASDVAATRHSWSNHVAGLEVAYASASRARA